MRRHITVQINGPILPGSVYCVVIGKPGRTLRTPNDNLSNCVQKARQFNQNQKRNLAHVEYVGQEKETNK